MTDTLGVSDTAGRTDTASETDTAGRNGTASETADTSDTASDTTDTSDTAGTSGVAAVLRAPQAVRVLVASQVGRLPLSSAPLALLLFARDAMSIAMAGILVGGYIAGTAVGQPLLARVADRWRQPPVMWAAVTVSTAGFALATLRPPPAVAVIAAVLAGVGAPPFESCLRVLWRDLIAERLLQAAYTLDVALQELIFIVGPMVALGGYALAGARGGLIATAVAQLAGTVLFSTAPVVRRWRGTPARRHWAGPLRSAELRLLLAATLLVGAAVGGTEVAVAGYADAHGSRSWAAWLLAAQAVGALTGGLLSTRYPLKDPRRALPALVALMAAGYLPLLLVAPLPLMAVALAVSGLMLPPALTAVFITADGVAPAGTAAESFAWVATAFATGSAVGSAVDGALCQAVGGVAIGFLPAPAIVAAAAALLWYRRHRRQLGAARPGVVTAG
ncbi:MFS transporter [Rugosimonospora africana]|uniref:MFS transporter n=1 Tax=Rugosimonospora africana TaxID=556532 RepID=A0A8J3QSY2_9ACTN|nr:MFS transporter [Rugosimonospora africana]